MRTQAIQYSGADRIFNIVNYFFLTLALIVTLYPLIYVLSSSFSSPRALLGGKVVLLPVDPTLKGYNAIFKYRTVWVGYANSLFYTVFGTSISVVLTIMAAYPLSRKDFYGRNLIMGIFAFTMFFTGGLIPTYLLVKGLGMLNTRWALLVPRAMGVWYVIIVRSFYQSNIPAGLLEASQMDGCSNVKFIVKVVVPLSGPITAVIVLWYAVGHWNSYFDALIYLRNANLFPLQLILREILTLNVISAELLSSIDVVAAFEAEAKRELLQYSLIIIASLPLFLMYPFIQRYFVRGIMIGAIKG